MATTRSRRRGRPASTGLTDKQQEIVALAAEGITAQQAADRLGIALSGIYNHMKRIREKGHAIDFAKAADNGHPAATAAATNGGGTSPDAAITEAARAALGKDATEYLTALDAVKQECVNRREEITREIASLRAEDEALETRIDKLAGRQAEAAGVVERIEALTA